MLYRRAAGVVSTLLVAMPCAAQCPPTFTALPSIATPQVNASGALADMNGDNTNDLVALEGGMNIRVYLNDGSAGLTALPATFAGGVGLIGVKLADVNSDGRQDAIVLRTTADTRIGILLGNGDGSVQPPAEILLGAVSGGPFAIGDVNADTFTDIAFIRNPGNTMQVLLGDGAGGFGAPADYSISTQMSNIVLAELNGAPGLDAAVSSSINQHFYTSFNSGTGIFGAATTYITGGNSGFIASGRLNADASNDIVVNRGTNTSVRVFPNDGAGGFFGSPLDVPIGGNPTSLAVQDMTADGLDDIIVTTGSNLIIARNIGNGSFAGPAAFFAGDQCNILAIGNLDADPKPEAILRTFNPTAIRVLINTTLTPLTLVMQPASVQVDPDAQAMLSVTASGSQPISHQWRRQGVPLVDGGSISGATSPTLTIAPATESFDDVYDVVVTGTCNTIVSRAAYVAVSDCTSSSPCPGDANGSGFVDFGDIAAVLASFGVSCP